MLVMLQQPSRHHKKLQLNPAKTTLLVLLCFLFFSSFPKPHHACQDLDRMSLLSFSHNLSTPLNWYSSSSSFLDCCHWEGVNCDGTGWVTTLSLPYKGLRGPFSLSLANLTHLSFLNLSHNFLSGPLPPSFLSSFDQLQTLDLSFNRFSGELPASAVLPNLPLSPLSLQFLDLSSNLFHGDFQLSFLGKASNLSMLNISNNSFIGIIPSSICQNYTSLKHLDVSLNGFSHEIPSGLGNCSQLEVFKAGWNQLTGPLPNDIYHILSLQQLSVPCNNISGTIDGTNQMVRLINLSVLDLSFNQFTGQLPQDIGNLTKLEQLALHMNHLSGPLPPSLTNCINLRVLSFSMNEFQGELSAIDFSKLIHLNTLDLAVNNFSGNLPMSLYSCTSLTAIRLSKNKLQGQIQPEILALRNLSYLAISVNRFTNITGALHILMQSRNLTTLLLTENFNGEAIPVDIDGFEKIRVLGIGGCQLTGQVPNWLINLRMLEVLDLSINQLTGSIPGWLGTLPRLFYVDLSNNFLTGELPKEFTALPTLAPSDQSAQAYLELPILVITQSSRAQVYNQLSRLPPAIYLRNNSLNGSIPPEIGLLQNLHILDLSSNKFSGEIPDGLSNLTNLETLDLSGNNLTGTIPVSLTELHFLSWFSVAYNNLEGPIPLGGQFDTFSPSSFVGNPGLCGPPVNRFCHDQDGETTTYTPATSNGTNLKHLLLVIGICIGCVSLFCVLTLLIILRIKLRGEESNKIHLELSSCSSDGGVAPHKVGNSSLVAFSKNCK
ncbi:receptor-like protein 2 [Macadamia integrifolia]|uniref:receptor-like protein 2 n=1 Tax=Macadamia integrifolia TaxID=60698 RepID=UPI001C4FFAA5|nr:receptor-like protein 2 [Macadamia integrifolia]